MKTQLAVTPVASFFHLKVSTFNPNMNCIWMSIAWAKVFHVTRLCLTWQHHVWNRCFCLVLTCGTTSIFGVWLQMRKSGFVACSRNGINHIKEELDGKGPIFVFKSVSRCANTVLWIIDLLYVCSGINDEAVMSLLQLVLSHFPG